MTTATEDPGWYPDPSGNGLLRWRDDKGWSDHVSTFPPPAGPPQAQKTEIHWQSRSWVAPRHVSRVAAVAGYLGIMAFAAVLAPLALDHKSMPGFLASILFAPAAALSGALAIRDLVQFPGNRGRVRAWFGLVSGLVWSIVGVVLFLVYASNA